MKTRTFAILSLALSLVLHLLLFRLPMHLLGANQILNPQDSDALSDAPIPLTIAPQTILDDLAQIEEVMQTGKTPPEQSPEFLLPNLPPEQNIAPLPDIFTPDDMRRRMADALQETLHEQPVSLYEMAGINETPPPIPAPLANAPDIPIPTAPAPEIIAVKVDAVPVNADPMRPFFADIPREFVANDVKLPSLAKPGELDLTGGQLPDIRRFSSQVTAPSIGLPGIGEGDFDIPELPEPPLPEITSMPTPVPVPQVSVKPDKQHPVAQPLDEFVNVRVTVYPDPTGKSGFFQVDISPRRNSDAMDEIPKDVLFIVDRSGSISLPKFEQFRQAIKELLPALNPQDRFNVISFNDKPYKFFENFLPATPKNLQNASEMVGRLPYGGKTDVFGGLAPFVKQSNGDLSRPLNIFLLTDGKSTVNIFRDNDFLHEIIGQNPGNVSIFPFSAGDNAKTNHSLLAFLGYLNHGELRHVDTLEQIRGGMAAFFQSYSNIIVADLQCRVLQGADPLEIYPRRLPHLYRNQTLTIFGRYADRNATLSLRITGRDATLTTRSLIFERKLANCIQGDEMLPERWAGQKLLYLLALRNSSNNPSEIARLEEAITELRKQHRTYSLY
ncbi:MAG: VWA domain-containing protein [Victivallales bacterium]|nr:VWA domain-containing protein [Victivallales bacterium]